MQYLLLLLLMLLTLVLLMMVMLVLVIKVRSGCAHFGELLFVTHHHARVSGVHDVLQVVQRGVWRDRNLLEREKMCTQRNARALRDRVER